MLRDSYRVFSLRADGERYVFTLFLGPADAPAEVGGRVYEARYFAAQECIALLLNWRWMH
jgi:hypothetical protein